MPLPGGAAEKLGIHYEGLWTALCMADVLAERADSIRLEPPGTEGEGFEFWLQKGTRREYHQTKRQRSERGQWSLPDLATEGVLRHFFEKLADSQAVCIFVSTQDASQLRELSERAQRATSWEEFDRDFLKPHTLRASFYDLCYRWGDCGQPRAYEALKRIRVQTISEDVLQSHVESILAPLVDGDPATVVDVLSQLGLERVNAELTANDLWARLESRGFRHRQWDKDPHVLAAAREATERYLRPLRTAAVADKVILREEARTAVDLLLSEDTKRGVLLVGEAGVGKSGVLLQAVDELRDRGWPVVALCVDRLDPTPLPDDVGRQIGLPGSPAKVLAAIARGRDCVLVIDQLDAVSLASGRQTGFFDCIGEIVVQAQAHPQMRLLLACRKFDLDNDPRLRRLAGENGVARPLMVGRLSDASVQGVLVQLGLDSSRLTPKQLELLSLPLHLSLLAEIVQESPASTLDFGTSRDLYDRFWDRKQDVLRERLGRPVHWTRVVDSLCDYMSGHQVLSVPEHVVDDIGEDARAMASEHVLILDGGRLAFFHEGFFDYAFSRRFVARGQDLLGFLRGDEQHLFRRTQVRQILLYERESDRARYLANLRTLITSPWIRFHLKQAVFALLAALPDPTEEEWNILKPFAEGGVPRFPAARQMERVLLKAGIRFFQRWAPKAIRVRTWLAGRLSMDACSPHVWGILYQSVPWFGLLDSLGLIERWLRGPDEELVDHTVTLLHRTQRHLANRVAELLEPYVDSPGPWRHRLVFLMQWADLMAGRRFMELFLRLLDTGALDEARGPIAVNSDFWSLVHPVAEKQPEWACEVIAHHLKRRLALAMAANQSNPFDSNSGTILHSQLDDMVFMKCAHEAPSTFIAELLPFMRQVMELNADRSGDPPWPDPVWQYRSYGGGYGVAEALLTGMVEAMSRVAGDEPDTFIRIASPLRDLEFETTQYLVIRAYAANGARFADEAAEYLCERPARFRIGYVEEPYWAARKLIEAISPHCAPEKLTELETAILAYYPAWERTVKGRRWHGHAQHVLLEGIVASRRSAAAARRLEELQRKFGGEKAKAPQRVETHWVGPPIPEIAAEKMTDEQWLRAIRRYDRDGMTERGERIEGGAQQLANLLENQVKRQPKRFAELALRIPDSAHPSYFDAILRGITDAGLDVDAVLRVCRRCHALPSRPCGRWITRPIAQLAQLSLPEEALEIVGWYAAEDSDPQRELWRTQTSGGGVYYGGDILTAAINSVRGSAAEAIAALIHQDQRRIAFFRRGLEQMVRDPSTSVRSCVAAVLIAVLRYDRESAVRLFLQLCETEEDRLLSTHYVERFLGYALPTHFRALEPIVMRMLSSDVPEVATVGARQVCLVALASEDARPLVHRCTSGTDAHRLGAAEVFSANLLSASFRSSCEEALTRLFDDPNEKVRSEAATCFQGLGGKSPAEFARLIAAFIQSQAFGTTPYNLLRALEETTAKLPDETCAVCERFLDIFGSEVTGVQTRAGIEAGAVSKLLIRMYGQSDDPSAHARCLDLIDRMTQTRMYGLSEALAQYER